ncbi:MAG: hypothetical protein H3C47_04215 [Candidatus Cloacimonetes bacterium]|nr:hypothetical protein [Candidatus Cloacimonadota bacterium]
MKDSEICHPLQKSEAVITTENQGSLLSPELNSRIRESLKARTAEPKVTENLVKPKPSLLSAQDKTVLKKLLQPKSLENQNQGPFTLPRQEKNFALHKLEKIEEQKQEELRRKEREKKVAEDLAFLEQMFSKPKKTNSQDSNRETVLARIEERRELARTAVSSAPVQNSLIEPETENQTLPDASLWLQANHKKRPATPSEQLQKYTVNNSSEWMTPVLTLAVFLYFCYVLYI